MPPTSTDISLPTGFVRRSHTVAQRPGIHTSSPPSRLQLKTTGKWCTNTLTLSLRWGRSVCATNPVLFPKIPPQDRAAVAHRGNSLKNTPYFAPTLCTSSFPSWCFGDPFPNTPLTLNSCLRDCVWGDPNQNYIHSPEVSHCLWNCTVYAWCATGLGSRIHSLNHSLVQKNVNGVPI